MRKLVCGVSWGIILPCNAKKQRYREIVTVMKKIPELCLLNSLLIDGGELGLGALLVRTATALLSCGSTSTLLLEGDNSDALSLNGSLAFALSLEKLEIGDAARRRGHGTG